jgi:hypothetical protein
MFSAIDRASNRSSRGMVMIPAAIAWRGVAKLPGDADLAPVLAVEASEDANGRKLTAG